jgi:hypothetical protein
MKPTHVPGLRLTVVLAITALLLAACGSSSGSVLATFTREWDDGRIETLELFDDGRVLMDHVGYIDRVTLSADDLGVLRASLDSIAPAADPDAFPRLTLTPAGATPVVVDTAPGTTGALFLSVLDVHRLP